MPKQICLFQVEVLLISEGPVKNVVLSIKLVSCKRPAVKGSPAEVLKTPQASDCGLRTAIFERQKVVELWVNSLQRVQRRIDGVFDIAWS